MNVIPCFVLEFALHFANPSLMAFSLMETVSSVAPYICKARSILNTLSENDYRLLAVNYFCKKFHLRFLTWVLNAYKVTFPRNFQINHSQPFYLFEVINRNIRKRFWCLLTFWCLVIHTLF